MEEQNQEINHRYKHWNGMCMCSFMDLLWAAMGLVIILLPGLILKLGMLGGNSAIVSAQRLYLSPALNAATIIISFALSIYAMAKSRGNYTVRTVALLALIVCIFKLVLLQ